MPAILKLAVCPTLMESMLRFIGGGPVKPLEAIFYIHKCFPKWRKLLPNVSWTPASLASHLNGRRRPAGLKALGLWFDSERPVNKKLANVSSFPTASTSGIRFCLQALVFRTPGGGCFLSAPPLSLSLLLFSLPRPSLTEYKLCHHEF